LTAEGSDALFPHPGLFQPILLRSTCRAAAKNSSVPRPSEVCYGPVSLGISIPDDAAAMLGSLQQEREQRAREAIALELYRQGGISLRVMVSSLG